MKVDSCHIFFTLSATAFLAFLQITRLQWPGPRCRLIFSHGRFPQSERGLHEHSKDASRDLLADQGLSPLVNPAELMIGMTGLSLRHGGASGRWIVHLRNESLDII